MSGEWEPRNLIIKCPLIDSDIQPFWENHCPRELVRGHIALFNVRRYNFLFYSSYWKFNSNWLFKTYPLRYNICLIGISYYPLVLRATVKTWHNRRHSLNKLITRGHTEAELNRGLWTCHMPLIKTSHQAKTRYAKLESHSTLILQQVFLRAARSGDMPSSTVSPHPDCFNPQHFWDKAGQILIDG